MNNKIKSIFGNSNQRIKNAIKKLKKGKGIILMDDENRENEGDLIFPAETMTIEQMAFTIRYGSGIVCLCITESLRKKLELPMMVEKNTSKYKTPFTITIEASSGVSTGVSAKDRIKTIQTAIADASIPSDLNQPGHIFPLCAQSGGILARPGHTEATIELMKLSGFKLTGVICELTNDDGSMAKLDEIIKFSITHDITVLTIQDLIQHLYR